MANPPASQDTSPDACRLGEQGPPSATTQFPPPSPCCRWNGNRPGAVRAKHRKALDLSSKMYTVDVLVQPWVYAQIVLSWIKANFKFKLSKLGTTTELSCTQKASRSCLLVFQAKLVIFCPVSLFQATTSLHPHVSPLSVIYYFTGQILFFLTVWGPK